MPILLHFFYFSGRSFIVLGGQHSAKICCEKREENLNRGLPLPDWQKWVLGSCLRHDTSIETRQCEAGNSQYRQGNVQALPLSATLNQYLQEMTEHGDRGERQCLAVAVQKTGAERHEKLVCPVALNC